jgi:hypothetical protein
MFRAPAAAFLQCGDEEPHHADAEMKRSEIVASEHGQSEPDAAHDGVQRYASSARRLTSTRAKAPPVSGRAVLVRILRRPRHRKGLPR